MTNVESGRAAAEAREQLKADPTIKTTHGDPLARYLGAVAYQEARKKVAEKDETDEKAE